MESLHGNNWNHLSVTMSNYMCKVKIWNRLSCIYCILYSNLSL